MPNFMSDYDIFDLLGLSSFDDQKKGQYLAKITGITLKKSFLKAQKGGKLSDSQLTSLEQKIAQTNDGVEVQKAILQEFPFVEQYMIEETNNFKKEALLSQIGAFMKFLSSSKQPITPDDQAFLNKFHDTVSKESENFGSQFSEYKALKTKYNFIEA